jgi:SAM-dependent methyltransferase
MHAQAREYVVAQATTHVLNRPGVHVLEIGSRADTGSVRDVFEHTHYTGVDLRAGPGVDEVGDAAALTDRDNSFDVILCLEVLEHTPEPQALLNAAHRMLIPGGRLLLTCATTGRPAHTVDGYPLNNGEFYRNVTRAQLLEWLAPFAVVVFSGCPAHHDLYVSATKGLEAS